MCQDDKVKAVIVLLVVSCIAYAGYAVLQRDRQIDSMIDAHNAYKATHQIPSADLIQGIYDKGFTAGVESVNIGESCRAWWFGGKAKERVLQSKQAYCKGNK